MNKNKINLNINLYSYGYSLNFLNLKIKKMNLDNLLKKHSKLNLNGIELPIDTLFSKINKFDDFYNKFSKKYKFYICFDDITNLNYNYLDYFNKLNIKNIRVRMPQDYNTVYGGNKFLIKKYKKNLNKFKNILNKYKNYFLKNNFFFCIENHQDLNSYDLIEIINELGSDFIGINWDIGNSIACGETPHDFFKNASKYIRNIHLKDYDIYFNGKIVKLNRVPLGKGYLKNINIKEFINHNASKSIELGAQVSRKCFVSNKRYWQFYNFDKIKIQRYYKFIIKNKNQKDNISDYEKNYSSKIIKNNEFNDFVSSYNYIRDYLK